MKKVLMATLVILIFITSCKNNDVQKVVEETASDNKEVVETTRNQQVNNEVIESVNKMTEREFAFDSSVDFRYVGNDKYLNEITSDMLKNAKENYDTNGVVIIPTPYIVKVDDSNKDDIKVYGDFWVFGYEMFGTIFYMKNGGSYPGCYHLKDENGNIMVLSREIAEDGSRFMPSLLKICGNDEKLADEVSHISNGDDREDKRIEFAKMYANENNLRLSGIKDYGWPVILFNDISDAEFIYNFYSAYFDEVRQDNVLNDMIDRLDNLKKKYMTSSLIDKLDNMMVDMGADAVIMAQDVTEQMEDTLQADDLGKGNVMITYALETTNAVKINVKVEKINGNKMITDISYQE